jgi:hypothetical protein
VVAVNALLLAATESESAPTNWFDVVMFVALLAFCAFVIWCICR